MGQRERGLGMVQQAAAYALFGQDSSDGSDASALDRFGPPLLAAAAGRRDQRRQQRRQQQCSADSAATLPLPIGAGQYGGGGGNVVGAAAGLPQLYGPQPSFGGPMFSPPCAGWSQGPLPGGQAGGQQQFNAGPGRGQPQAPPAWATPQVRGPMPVMPPDIQISVV